MDNIEFIEMINESQQQMCDIINHNKSNMLRDLESAKNDCSNALITLERAHEELLCKQQKVKDTLLDISKCAGISFK